MKNFQVAIDGPAGSGKSTISKLIAKELKFQYLDTGAMYRAITYQALALKINLEDDTAYQFIEKLKLEYKNDKMYLNGKDVSLEIRKPNVTNNVSTVAKNKSVRIKMKDFQQKIASNGQVILDGRDIGSNVLPNANLKVFLTATIECRANRRFLENQAAGIKSSLKELLEEIALRDHTDATRKYAPLKKADDAVTIDTTELSINEVCAEIIKLIHERMF
ncbi:MAG: (d)CMP kinase [Erysipelotrichales bacterium]|nr:(d)CMP kinase [Erysipelotrichales bacterium]